MTSSTSSNPLVTHKEIIKKLIALLLMFCFRYIPPFGEITPLGMQVLGAFLGAVFGFVCIGITWTALTGALALGMTDAYATLPDAFAAYYGSQTSLLMLGSLFMCALVIKLDLASVIVDAFTSLKIAKNKPFVMMFFLFLSSWIVGTMSFCMVAAVLMVELYRGMVKKCNVPAQHPTNSFFLVGVAVAALFGDLTFPFRPLAYTIMSAYASFSSAEISFTAWVLTVTPSLLLVILLYVLAGKYIFRIDMSYFADTSVFHLQAQTTKKQKQALFWLGIVMLLWFLPTFTAGGTSSFCAIINRLGLGGITVVSMVVMMLWEVEGKPLLILEELSEHFQWGVYFCVCFFVPLGSFLSSDTSGISATITSLVAPLLTGLSPIIFLIVAVIMACLFTNILNNLVVAMIFITLLYSVAPLLGGALNMPAATLSIMLGAYTACMTPAGNPTCAYLFTLTDLISFKNQLLMGAKACVVIVVFIICIFYPVASFIV